jgi:hypothetical protein
MKITRRGAIGLITAAGGAALEPQNNEPGGTALNWLGEAPPLASGISWGVPWPRGAVRKERSFRLTASSGESLPLQSWPLAWWPDGSVKWTGFATVTNAAAPLTLAPGTPAAPSTPVKIETSRTGISIDMGRMQCRVPAAGADVLQAMKMEGREVVAGARLVCMLEGGAVFNSSIRKITAEQTGPVRAVVRIEGVHKAAEGAREWLPFVVRLYFFAGHENVRVVHTIVFDGDEQKDFIRGLGLVFSVPMREQLHNRHVRFSAETGLWSEPVKPLTGRRMLGPGIYVDQLAGKRIANRENFNAAGQKLISDWADWGAYKLVQPNADGFTIQKRTNPQSCWLQAAGGRRASGLVFAGDVSGGLAVGVKNFWQSYPAALEIQNATGDAADLHVWLWSPDAPAMDLRHYDTRAHNLDSSYEDVQPGFSTPHGVARTSEMTLFPSAGVPAKTQTLQQATMAQHPPLLAATPRHIHSTGVFGIWSLQDRGTPARSQMEDHLDAAFALYQKEVEQRHWYGFWDYGDVMHQYDGPRHMWRYDIGGFAWDNTELGTDVWLWYSFLRTGRADIFRMAEAMTRHTSEVDVYHLGRFAPLGSRHNVRHWGCGAKEPRISQAAYRRFYYYLTTDERTGDLMRAVLDVDRKTIEIDPMRLAAPLTAKLPYPGRVRGGPDWLAFVGNWMTEWERTGDAKYRDKILTGMDSIAAMPFGFLTGGPNQLYGYDPESGKLYVLDNRVGTYNLATIMGGAEVVFELNTLIDHPGWRKAWDQYCRLHTAPQPVVARDDASGNEGADARYARPGRLSGYLYMLTKNPAFAAKAWAGVRRARYGTTHVEGADVLAPIDEVQGISTNSTAQGCLESGNDRNFRDVRRPDAVRRSVPVRRY